MVQKCQKCGNRFKWKSMEKSLIFGYKPITCSRCDSTHYAGFWTRIILSVLVTMVPMGLLFMRMISLRLEYWIAFYLLWATLVMAMAPLFARYHIRETREDTRPQGE